MRVHFRLAGGHHLQRVDRSTTASNRVRKSGECTAERAVADLQRIGREWSAGSSAFRAGKGQHGEKRHVPSSKSIIKMVGPDSAPKQAEIPAAIDWEFARANTTGW